ncbi:AbrB/MazE/SpoVT family DNA-binding domain-containing protein [uncultured Sphaerotilus sp.]|uniref:antitoxin n=1 Tax=uncultured Sphaerotilus sp. TaxID=474984 RepID=UPI0030CA56A4
MAALTTRIFRSGNSLAVRIPRDLLPDDVPDEAEIEWRHGAWIIRPVRRQSLAGLMDVFAEFPADFMAEGREFHEQQERDWSALDEAATSEAQEPR